MKKLLILLLIVGCSYKHHKKSALTKKQINEIPSKYKDGTTFIAYDQPPKPLQPLHPTYPTTAKEKGIEGTVYIQIFINEKGIVTETKIMKGVPALNEAALDAVKKSKWKPAQQRDKIVGAWLTIPFRFALPSN